MAFEEHVRNARALRGQEVPPAWYEIPVFYFTNPGAVYGDGEDIPMPADTQMLDYELELACVIGADGRPEGFTIMNDFSARDLQFAGDAGGAGAGQGQGLRHGPGAGPRLARRAAGPIWTCAPSPGSTARCAPTAAPATSTTRGSRLIEAAARNTPGLIAGEVIGSGTVGRGCILEHGDGRWLARGDEIELEIEGIGVLRNRVV